MTFAANRSDNTASGVPAAGAHGFDFLHGRWAVRHAKLRERLAGDDAWITFAGTLEVGPILGGAGNFDDNWLADPAGAYQAHSLRIFAPETQEWSVWWLDARDPGAGVGRAVVGRFEGRKITLFGDDHLAERPIRVRTTYESLDPSQARWTQAFQADEARWEVNWVMDFTRVAE